MSPSGPTPAELAQSDARFRALAARSSDLLAEVGSDLLMTYIAPSVTDHLGYDRDALLGHDVTSCVHPDDRNAVITWLQHVVATDEAGGDPIAIRLGTADGRWLHYRLTPSAYEAGGERRVVLIGQNIERRRQLRAEREAIFDGLHNGISLVIGEQANGMPRRVYCNPALAEMVGYDREELRRLPASIAHPDDWEAALAYGRRIRSGGVAGGRIRMHLQRRDGSSVPVETVGYPYLEDGVTLGVIWEHRDLRPELEAQRALAEREERYRLLIEHSQHGVALLDGDANLVTANPALAAMVGYTPEEYEALPASQRFRASSLPTLRENLRRMRAGENRVQARVELAHRDGSTVISDLAVTAVRIDGEIQDFIVDHRDVTAEVQAQEQLATSEHQYRTLVEYSQNGIALVTPAGQLITVNPALAAMLGYTVEEYYQVPPDEVFSAADWSALESTLDRLHAGEDRIQQRVHMRHRDGSSVVVDMAVTAVRIGGELTSFIADHSDVTAEVEAQEQLATSEQHHRLLVEHSQNGISLLDASGSRLAVNTRLAQMLGYTVDEYMQLQPDDLYTPEDWERVLQAVGQLRAGSERERLRVSPWHRDGSRLEFDTAVAAVRIQGELTGFIVDHRDVTAEVEAQQQLAASEERYRSLVEHSRNGILLLNRDGVPLAGNLAHARLLGCDTVEEALTWPGSEIFSGADLDRLAVIRRQLLEGQNSRIEERFRMHRRDESVAVVEVAFTAIRTGGEVTAILVDHLDLTAQIEATEGLAASERRYRQLTELSQNGITLIGPEGDRLLATNTALASLCGYTVDELLSLTPHALFGDSEPEMRAMQGRLHQGADRTYGRLTLHHRHGHHLLVDVALTAMRDSGILTGFLADYRDVTAQVAALEQLEDSERRYRLLFERSQNGLVLLNPDRTATNVNPAMAEMLGYAPDEYLAIARDERVHPDDLERLLYWFDRVVAEAGRIEQARIRFLHRDGDIITTDVAMSALTDGEEVVGVIAEHRDVSAQLEARALLEASEHRMRTILSHSQSGIVMVSDPAQPQYVNPTMAAMLGYTPEEFLATPRERRIHGEDLPRLDAEFAALRASPGEPRHFRLRFLHRAGRTITADVTMSALLEGNEFVGAVADHRDVTQEIEAQARLEASEQRYRTLFERSQNGLGIMDPASAVIDVNPAMAAMVGYATTQEFLDSALEQRIHPDDLPRAYESFQRAVEHPGEPVSVRLRYRHRVEPDRLVLADVMLSALLDGDEVIGVLAEHRDVTNEVTALERLEASERHYRQLFERAQNGMLLIDTRSIIRDANEAMAQMQGYEVDEYLRLPPDSRVHPHDVPALAERFAAVVREPHVPRDPLRLRLLHRDPGRIVISQVAHRALFDGDNVTSVIAEHRDITAEVAALQRLEESEERYRLLFEMVPDGILLSDIEGTPLLVNEAMCRLVGYSRDELMAMNRLDLVHPDELADTLALRAARVSGHHDPVHVVRRLLHRDGSEVLANVTAVSVFQGEQFIGVMGIYTDVTAQVELQHEVEQQRERARRAVVREEFLATMSHELRTPLTSILGFAELLDMGVAGELEERQRGYMHEIVSAAEQLLALINDILDMSKIDSGKISIAPAPVAPAMLAEEVTRSLGPVARQSNVSLHLETAAAPDVVVVDPRGFRQIVTNLVSNAIKFSRDGDVTVSLSTAGSNLVIVVSDTGVGIEPDRLDLVFEPFTQADASLARTFGGTGLGLTIATRLIEVHDGRIMLCSMPGEGTTIRVQLPLEPAQRHSAGEGAPGDD